MEARWLGWVGRLQAIAYNGLMVSKDRSDRERYKHMRSVATDILASARFQPH